MTILMCCVLLRCPVNRYVVYGYLSPFVAYTPIFIASITCYHIILRRDDTHDYNRIHLHVCDHKICKELASFLLKAQWASSWDYGTYRIGEQRRLRRDCASAQSRQSLRCSHTQRMEVDEGSDQNQTCSPSGLLRMRVWRLSLRRAMCQNLMSWLEWTVQRVPQWQHDTKSEQRMQNKHTNALKGVWI